MMGEHLPSAASADMVNFDDVLSAAAHVAGFSTRTRTLVSPSLNQRTGRELFLKAEHEQRSGSFKFRGALNAMLTLTPAQLRMGVVAGSSGNHGHAVALASRLLGATAVIVLPHDAPAVKREAVLALGGRVVRYDRMHELRDEVVERIARDDGQVVIPSSDSVAVIAGAGTVAVELLEDSMPLDMLVVPVGGGGLAAGCAIAVRALSPATRVVGVEPVDGDDTRRSLAAGCRVGVAVPATIADGLRHQMPGRLTFEVNRRLLHAVVLVSDAEIVDAMTALYEAEGTAAEPSGACALAAVLSGRLAAAPRTRVGVVISGGNMDADSAHRLIAAAPCAATAQRATSGSTFSGSARETGWPPQQPVRRRTSSGSS